MEALRATACLEPKEGRRESLVYYVSGWQRGFSEGNGSSAVRKRAEAKART